ncbi:MAG TPA: glucoamylase family protein, partial [Chloroflexia bacterium]|nr:glucoamylase family protein [Chloroflexia bacterium]
QPSLHRPRRPLPAAAQTELRRIARRIWHFYELFAGPEDNWLPPDNFQLEPAAVVAHRTSPTNIGFLMLSALAAHDFGYLDGYSLIDRLEHILGTVEKLQRHRGHLLNWYQTQSLQALGPEYISTVDSGNLAACLLVVKQACFQAGAWPIAPSAGLSGLRETAAELVHVIQQYPAESTAARSAVRELLAAAGGLLELLPVEGADASWLRALEQVEREASALGQQAQSLAGTRGVPDAGPLIGWTESLLGQVRGWRRWAAHFWDPDTPAAGNLSVAQLGADTAGPAFAAARDLTTRAAALAARAEALAAGMDFGFLFNPERGVFSIGYNLPAQTLDNSYYDLLASEARLASLVAVARGQVPPRHWFRLGRPLTWAGDSLAVLSWGGTMFEYLMPSLLVHDYPATLLEQTAYAVVRAQRRFGETHRVPWGVSESGFHAFDYQLNYQYQSFGVPELSLRRDQADNVVIAPYATFLALPVDPPAAWDNLQRLAREGAAGPYGYYEALDYTPSRRPRGQSVAIVASFMAHHQGMSLVALDNYLNDSPMLRRFHSEASIAAIELLLQERVPRHAPVMEPHPETETDQPGEGRLPDGARSASVRWFSTPHTPTPRTHVLSNSTYEVMITNAGGGYSHYNDPVSGRTVAVTRWRPDITLDDWGTFIYLQDTASGQTWSATYQPTAREPEGYEASYSVDRVEFRRRDLGIESHLEIVVSPRDNVEIRRVTLTNRSRRVRTLSATSFAELVLDTPEADLAHPAFGKLFVESEYLDERQALLFRRRPRAAGQPHPWALHLVVADRPLAGPVEYETDRARFLGRGQSTRQPAALRSPLSKTVGAVLDPVLSLRANVKLAPAESATIVFVTGVGADRDAVLALADKYHDPRIVESTQELAWVYSQIQLRHLNITDEDAHLYQRLASRILYPDVALRAPAEVLKQNRRGQSALWAYGLSGDNPILLVEVDEDGELDLTRQLLRAHEYWRLNNFVVDLVILNEHATSYAEGLEGQLRALINTSLSHPWLDKPGGVFIRRADRMPVEDQVMLKTVARVVLDGNAGTLLEQIERSAHTAPIVPPAPPVARAEPPTAAVEATAPRPDRQFDNGLGGFSADGREYIITLNGAEWTPMPWA